METDSFCVICNRKGMSTVRGTTFSVHRHIVITHGKSDDYAKDFTDPATHYMATCGKPYIFKSDRVDTNDSKGDVVYIDAPPAQ